MLNSWSFCFHKPHVCAALRCMCFHKTLTLANRGTEVFLKHQKHSSTLAVELCWRDELSGRTHVSLQYFYLGPNYPHGSLLAVFIPIFLGHDLPCVAMELLFEEWEINMAETVRIKCAQSMLNISMMQETVRVGDAADCGTVLWSVLAHIQNWTVWNWYDSWTHIFWIFHCFITISSSHYLKHCYEL